jgi:dTDP-glucose 4,6-dehydratase
MKIVVTGHLGTIGQPLVRALRAVGHEVIGIDLRHDADGVRADVADYRQLEAAVPRDVELVYHLAAEFGRYNGEDFTEQLWRTNATGTKNVLRLQKDRRFKLIFASSSEVYGERREDMLREDLPLSPFYLSNDYAISKLVNEGQIVNAQKQWGSEIMTLRFFNAYGPGEFYHAYRSVVCLFAYRALKRLPYTVYEGYYRVFQYVDDLVATLVRAADRFHPGLIANVGGREFCSVRDLHELITRHVDVDPKLVTFLPEEKHNVVSKRPNIYFAETFLGHNPVVELREGLPKTIEWLKQTYAL